MKKTIALLILLQFIALFNSCSSGSEEEDNTPPEIINASIQSYSKDYGTTGDTITITGEKFSTKTSEIKITFDGVAATILSTTESEIKFILPATEKLLPKLALTIENRTVTNTVKNKYNGAIGIFPIPSTTSWVVMENYYKSNTKIQRIKMLSNKILYYNTDVTGTLIYRTLDGGITWNPWSLNGLRGGFYATINDEGWSDTGFTVSRIAMGGYLEGSNDLIKLDKMNSVYVEDNMQKGTIVSQKGVVYTTINGKDFNKEYDLNNINVHISNSTEMDNNHIWTIGYTWQNGSKPFVFYKNNITDNWKEYIFSNEMDYTAQEICFVDYSTGFLLVDKRDIYDFTILDVKLYKTTDGGDNWSPVYNGEKFTKFTFKDGMTGWAILDNKIYKTTNGGTQWTLDYNHDQPIRNIAYKNNVVWAISKDKILKRFL